MSTLRSQNSAGPVLRGSGGRFVGFGGVAGFGKLAVVGLAVACSALCGCEPDYHTGPPPRPGSTGGGGGVASGRPDAGAVGGDADAGNDAGVDAGVQYHDDDFIESNVNRDPFRSYARLFKVRPPEVPQRTVLMPTTSVDDVRLIAIVSGVPDPRAMFVDASGVGYVVSRGDYVCRGETVQTGGEQGMSVMLHWRVDRIREGEVVLTREDPTAPNRPPLSRVIPLYDDSDAQQEMLRRVRAAGSLGVSALTIPGVAPARVPDESAAPDERALPPRDGRR
jgi:type IV pilus assembly protein PilP